MDLGFGCPGDELLIGLGGWALSRGGESFHNAPVWWDGRWLARVGARHRVFLRAEIISTLWK